MTDKDSVGIIIKDQSTGPYYCNSDNFQTTSTKQRNRGIHLSPLAVQYFPNLEKVKKGTSLRLLQDVTSMPLVSLVKDSNTEPSSVYHKPKISPSIHKF